MVDSFRDLVVWQRAVQLSVATYQLTATFPADERFGLTSQLRRAAVSIASNIAEGYGRGTTADYKHFLRIARGSNFEAQTQLVIAEELGFGGEDDLLRVISLSTEVGKMLVSMLNKL